MDMWIKRQVRHKRLNRKYNIDEDDDNKNDNDNDYYYHYHNDQQDPWKFCKAKNNDNDRMRGPPHSFFHLPASIFGLPSPFSFLSFSTFSFPVLPPPLILRSFLTSLLPYYFKP